MELLRGETLLSRLRRVGPYPPEAALSLLEQMAAGLETAHEAGVIHADLKSENVMLVADRHAACAVITDFGLAEDHDGLATRMRGSRPFLAGTIGYMAPERLSGGPATRASDIYALGVVLFEMLTGHLPFDPSSLRAALDGDGRSLQPKPELLLRLPLGWRPAIERCIHPCPTARFDRAPAVVEAIRNSLPLAQEGAAYSACRCPRVATGASSRPLRSRPRGRTGVEQVKSGP
jgi:serine/threonine-protein kinase